MAQRKRLMGRSYVVYYGRGPLAGIESYDVAVLEPQGWSTPQLRALQEKSVTCLAYLSVLEVPDWRVSRAGLTDRDFLRVDGQHWIKEPFGNRLAQPDAKHWRDFLNREVDTLYRAGWDGLFLDTLGDVEDPVLLDKAPGLVAQTADLVRFLSFAFPDRPIIVNNGLWRLVPLIADYISGVCWEGDLTPELLKEPWAQAMIDFLGRHAQERGWVNVMLTRIDGTSVSATKALVRFMEEADRYGFLSYAAPGNYAEAIRLRDGRVVGPHA